MSTQNINNLVELFFINYKKQKKDNILLTSLKDNRNYFTWEKTFHSIKKLSSEIKKYVNKGDRCLLISENRPEWFITDLSVMLSEAITVPAYTTYAEKDYEYIIENCNPKLIFVSNQEQFNKVKEIIKKKSFVTKIFSFEQLDIDSESYINVNKLFFNLDYQDLKIPDLSIKRKDPACIIYTSGTQGNPKGVILSHGGILNNCDGALDILKPLLTDQTRFLTWLPLSHSYEHTVQFVQISVGAKIFYAESIEKLIKNMNDCKPQLMTAVPRFYQNLFQKINASFNKATGLKKKLIIKMLELGTKKINKRSLTILEKLIDNILEKIVRKKISNQAKNIFLLHQIHSNRLIFLNKHTHNSKKVKADAVITNIAKLPIGILTADCAPILLYDYKKNMIAAIHAGWKGAFKGIVSNVLNFMVKKGCKKNHITAAIGPCISSQSYNVKEDLKKGMKYKREHNIQNPILYAATTLYSGNRGIISRAGSSDEDKAKFELDFIENILSKIKDREKAKKTGDYKMADKIRDDLNKEGIDIKDEKGKTTWSYK